MRDRVNVVSGPLVIADETFSFLGSGVGRRVRAALADVDRAVLVSSATVYGAWPDNPVPLAEDARLRPNPGFAFAAAHAEVERTAREWSTETGGALAVLRPVTVLSWGGGAGEELSRALTADAPVPLSSESPPVQYLHPDDLAAAVRVAVERGLVGTYNVAPPGWLAGEEAAALRRGARRVILPAALGRAAARWRPAHVAVRPYLVHPWVVASDRLVTAGWRPRQSNAEALIAALEARPRLSGARRG
jgi:nucleoside-diphosphate-sugar epimerase